MAIAITCPRCGSGYRLEDALRGKRVRCRDCQEPFPVLLPADREEPLDVVRAEPAAPEVLAASCPRCGASYQLHSELDGKRVRCRECHAPFRVGEPAPADEEDGEDRVGSLADRGRRSPAALRSRSGGSGMPVALFVVGGVVLLVLAGCFGAYWWFVSTMKQQMAAMGSYRAPGMPPADVDEAIDDLKAPDPYTRLTAANWLQAMPPDEWHRDAVVAALEPLLTDPDISTRQAAGQALCRWAADRHQTSLIKAAASDQPLVRQEAIRALARMPNEEAAQTVAECLPRDTLEASKALKTMGHVAEKPLAEYLVSPDPRMRTEACRILQVIGTKESLPALEQVAREDRNPGVTRAAAEAVKAIKARP